jgi:4-hydroxy-tetrahydrodipicolinate synthase
MKTQIITALCTPLNADHSLHVGGLEAHIQDQRRHGIAGLLVAGTMGLMQLQTDRTYRDLVEQSVRINQGYGELMVGVGDTSYARTRERIQLVERFAVDAVVVLSPYLIKFSQTELIDYFRSLADISTKPLYLYDLPGLTGTRLELATVAELASHPNIRGIKCSGAWDETRQLRDAVSPRLRVIPAQPHLVDELIRMGVPDNLDGVFGLAPGWTTKIAQAAEAEDWTAAAAWQKKLSDLLRLLRGRYTVFGGCETIFNARGIEGRLAPAPLARLDGKQRAELLAEPLVEELMRDEAQSGGERIK